MRHVKSLIALLGVGIASLTAAAKPDPRDAETALANADTYTALVKTAVRYPFGEDSKGRSRGAGFVVDRD